MMSPFPAPQVKRLTPATPPAYREAYPMLNIQEMKRHTLRGPSHIIWRDRQGNVAAIAKLSLSSPELATIDYRVLPLPYLSQSERVIEVSIIQRGDVDLRKRSFAICPRCAAEAGVLVFNGTWGCAFCSNLPNRSSLVAIDVRRSERLEELDAELLVGRLPGERNAAFGKKVAERAILVKALKGKKIVANALTLPRIQGEWVKSFTPVQP